MIRKAQLTEISRLIDELDTVTSEEFKLTGGLKLHDKDSNEVLGFISHGDEGWYFAPPVTKIEQNQPQIPFYPPGIRGIEGQSLTPAQEYILYQQQQMGQPNLPKAVTRGGRQVEPTNPRQESEFNSGQELPSE